ncbi:MAG TPA: acyl-phosphate glycerol 3-phosphate acyltransferase [Clostridiales bacterium]|nr:acyl-phosphate glycerol 3-phosphate acyltransferase [Clostridiales bacterium]
MFDIPGFAISGMLILIPVIAYLIGGIPFSYVFSKTIKGEDIRERGSGNAGTTNALRSYGWGLGLLTLIGDVMKGVVAALIGLWLGGETGLYIAGVFAVVGHNFSIYLKFKGGKGIAATTGVLLIIQPIPTIVIFGTCVLIVVATKIMSIGSLIGLCASVVAAFILSNGNLLWSFSVLIIALLGIFSHRENISRLAQGNERKLNLSKK